MALRLLLLLVALLAPAAGRADELPTREWTVLLFFAADDATEAVASALPPRAYRDLHALAAGGRSAPAVAGAAPAEPEPEPAVAVVAELDIYEPVGIWRLHVTPRPIPFEADRPLADWADADPDDIPAAVVEVRADESPPPAAALEAFLDWGVAAFPARHYAVVVWGHGFGWRPRDAAGPYRRTVSLGGVALDDSQGTVLAIPDLRDALRAVADRRLGGRPFDLFAADACLMQTVEVVTELHDAARFVVGFEQIEYIGLPYHDLVPALLARGPRAAATRCEPDAAACAAAAGLVAAQRAAQRSAAALDTWTVSAVDSAALADRLLPALDAVAAAIEGWLAEDGWHAMDLAALLSGLDERGSRNAGVGRPALFHGGTRDLGVLLDRLADLAAAGVQPGAPLSSAAPPPPAAAQLAAAVAAARAALAEAVVAQAIGPAYTDRDRMAGLAVWLPRTGDELAARGDFFAASRFYAAFRPAAGAPSRWRAWLERTFAAP